MQKEPAKNYSPKDFEDKLYKMWEENGYFSPSMDKSKPHFSVVIPPPNVTGQLHMGHALNNTLQDIIVRTKRMEGYNTLWVPGTDHAGIATQIKVEENLRKEKGLSRHDIGREEFLKLVWDWKNKYGDRIITQLKKMGTSCDWNREAFTMSESLSRAVKKVFVRLYDKGLIYRGFRITNWCTHCATALSDAEVEYKELEGGFWYVRYPVKGSENEFVTIATTRPETMLGDTAVAVNPDDERFRHLVGKTLILPLMGREIPVVADEYVEKDFGTGCVKITPCHDPNDFELGKRHDLPQIVVIDENGIINENGGKYQGLDRNEARKRIVEDLEAGGFLVKKEKLVHNVAHCYRCGSIIEPLASRQWFVKMKPLAEPAIAAVKDGRIRFIPDRFSKIYLNWMENIQDWCISRQLWWGHRIPAYYCDDCGQITVSENSVNVCPKCGGAHVRQEEDVLDTWFSSALWPFSTLGWPDSTEDMRTFYPTSALVTAYDIITFWVSKMIFMAIENTGDIPFPDVFIHGLVRDELGRKMSKSLGNGIDPLQVIDEYGTDALRYALATGNAPGNDMRFSQEKIESARNFINKIWNASRFVRMNLSIESASVPDSGALAVEDKWILSKLNRLTAEVRENIDKYELGVALQKLTDFVWDDFCDWYIELAKERLCNRDNPDNLIAQNVISYTLERTMRLLHPFLPFITEEIWQSIPHEGESVMIAPYPDFSEKLNFEDAEIKMSKVIALIRGIRARRTEMNVAPSRKTKVFIVCADGFIDGALSHFFTRLASASEVIFADAYDGQDAVQIVTDSATAYIPLADMIDTEKELLRLGKEKANLEGEIERIEKKLLNDGFVKKAPAQVVEGERVKLENYRASLDGVVAAINKLQK
ncbi:MAG: valine--tRNA ligase [Clostridia bacterium]|nr:valine--tRNA ligase [Clostridia bacterium]